jgi:hypothetical protein
MKIITKLFVPILFLGVIGCKKDHKTSPHTLTLQPGAEGHDAYVSKIDNNASDGNANLGDLDEIVVGRWNSNFGGVATERSYLKFTGLKDIPSNATVTSAKLYLYGKSSSITYPNGNSTFPGSPNGDNTSVIQRVTGADWTESVISWNTMPAASDVNQVTIPASTSQWNYSVTVDVTALVQEMVAHPSTNYGFMLRLANEAASRSLIFASSEYAVTTSRPKLVVDATY